MFCSYRKFQFIIIIIMFELSKNSEEAKNDSLVLVHVIFCHGEKPMEPDLFQPNDPYRNETFCDDGQLLTMVGKRRSYQLGKSLRENYEEFLGGESSFLEARSFDTDISKISIELVLAGLFPPSEEYKIVPELNWQPIPFTSVPSRDDNLFFGISCPNYENYLEVYSRSRKMRNQFSDHRHTFDYLTENSGVNITSYSDVLQLYERIKIEEGIGSTLPEWTESVYPEPMRELAVKTFETETGTVNLRRLAAGYLLKKIVDDTKNKLSRRQTNKKIFLYSGHRFNIAHLLITLDIFDQEITPYGSYVSFEVHRINGVDGIKIFYGKNDSAPAQLKLPACSEFCPFQHFSAIAEEYRPPEGICGKR